MIDELGGIRSKFTEYVAIYDNGNSGTSKTIDWLNGNIQKITMTDDCTLTFSSPLTGEHRLFVYNGGTAYTITWPASVIWLNENEPELEVNSIFMCDFPYDGTYYYGMFGIFLEP